MIPDYHFISGFGSVYTQSSLKNRITEHYPDSQVISQQELRIPICWTLSINIINASFDHRYSTAVLKIDIMSRIMWLLQALHKNHTTSDAPEEKVRGNNDWFYF